MKTLKQWKFEPSLYNSTIVKDHFILLRKSIYNEVTHVMFQPMLISRAPHVHPYNALLPPYSKGPNALGITHNPELPIRRFNLTNPHAIVMPFHGKPVHNFFCYLEEKYAEMLRRHMLPHILFYKIINIILFSNFK